MARRDVIHGPVRKALTNDGWHIIADPYRIVYKDTTLEADMKADKLLVATRDKRSIIVEVKSFLQQSFIHEFLAACGHIKPIDSSWKRKDRPKQFTWQSAMRSIAVSSTAKLCRYLSNDLAFVYLS